ncbi:uncharacterized protein LOC130719965 [Lotus japonicus]|uniref:uncharacterized protein LOC130719965 n=1 Tax=Lotus japonicus TaxID=34305 RepID=UPI002587E2DB|nr:uncharacterized protein LOC130719965 [Lotus japonicus]
MKIVHYNDNPMLPQVITDADAIKELCYPWQEALVVSLLGKKLGYRTMKSRLSAVWRLTADFDLLDIDNGFFMVKFDLAADRTKVMEGGPWMIFDHYLAVSTWNKDFLSPLAKVSKTLAWIRIPGLNVVFYDESFLLGVATAVGKPIRVDGNTLRAERGKFARICVELDLAKPVIGKICIEGFWYKVEYEGLHIICSKCGCYGHRGRDCTSGTPTAMLKEQEAPPSQSQQDTPNPSAPTAGANIQEDNSQNIETDVLMGADSQGIIPGGLMVNDVFIMEKPHNMPDADCEILGEWMVVTKKKRGPKNQPSNGKNLQTLMEKNKAPPNQELKGNGILAPQGKSTHVAIEDDINKGKQQEETGRDHTRQGKFVGEKVWIKKRKEGPTRAEKDNAKTQNSNLLGSVPNFHMGSTSQIINVEKDTGAKVREQVQRTGDNQQAPVPVCPMATEMIDGVFKAGTQSAVAYGSRPPDNSQGGDHEMEVACGVQPTESISTDEIAPGQEPNISTT